MPTPEQMSRLSLSKKLDLFKTTCKILKILKAIERIWARQRLMPWFRAVMTAWVFERAKRLMSRNMEAYQSFQLDVGRGAYKRAFLTHRNAVTTAVKRVAGMSCTTEQERNEQLNVDLLLSCKPRLLEHEKWGTARNSVDMLQKVLEDSEMGELEQETWSES